MSTFDYSRLRTRKWVNDALHGSGNSTQSTAEPLSLLFSQSTSSSVKKARYQCGKCDKMLCTLAGFRNHLRRTHGEGNCYKCEECDKSFKHASGLCQHRTSFHGQLSLECKKCQKAFNSRGNLKRHLQTHTRTVEELEEFWKENYVQTPRQVKALERSHLHYELYKEEPKQEASTSSSDDSQPLFAPLVYKANDVAELRNPKMPRFNHLRLGSTIFPGISRFREGKLFHLPSFVDRDDSSFTVFSCSSCKLTNLSRLALENHYYREHRALMDSGKYCEICMKLVNDMASHIRIHHIAFSEINRFSLFPEPYTSH